MNLKKNRHMLRMAAIVLATVLVVGNSMKYEAFAAVSMEAGASKVVSISVGEDATVSDNSSTSASQESSEPSEADSLREGGMR